MKNKSPTRRHFLGAAALAGLYAGIPVGAPSQEAEAASAAGATAENDLSEITEQGPGFQMDLWCLPRVQFWSFDNQDPILQAHGLNFFVQIVTAGPDENTYSLRSGAVKYQTEDDATSITAGELTTAAQQDGVAGKCRVRVTRQGERIGITVEATVEKQPVRAIKLVLRSLPAGRVGFTSFEGVRNMAPVPRESLALSYPSYQGGAPVWFLATDGEEGISFSSIDVTARQRRFVASQEPGGGSRIELIFEQDARQREDTFTAPEWEVRHQTTLDAAIAARCVLLERDAGLQPWERRTDVPAWVHDIGLVVCLHGMHWSGRILQNFATMKASIDWVTARIPGKHVLFFLAGWEGRYYRSYGDSRPHPKMGGAAGFQAMLTAAHGMGAHVMAMYAGNAAMPGTPGFEDYAPGSHFEADGSLSWTPLRGYSVDWATVRGSDQDGAAWLNPGAPGWQKHLTDQVRSTIRDFGIDGAFFDTQPNFDNDRRFSPAEGLRKIVANLRNETPGLMIATESWADITYSFLHSGQTPGSYKNWSRRYGRRFAHLAMGEPSRGSTGVHELGYCEYNFEQLMTLFDWPTLALVDTTLRDAPEKAARVINYANAHLRKS